ncbi:cytochrome P450 [Mycobacterium shimoidei]|uniref:cytochrome P450 n=1 Tax=Mycobacterium shimoidei TaxID=29313 RepID=UPI00084955E3|nr:cytochrome P450 [Mycobacterium shimoidei]MCV7260369.1 cytochrome P450 [Mycobacterium shimoidei]ODR12995.1 cytochrome P450 [Mycobacterium shimoidei]ORW82142.1 cytochrome P450 [Mycobacterium shimoidei]
MAVATTEPVRLPPRLRLPKLIQGIGFGPAKHQMFGALYRRWGTPFTVNLPLLGKTVVVSDKDLLKDLFTTSIDLIERPVDLLSLGEIFGPGSTFALTGQEHLARRRLLTRPFHGKQLRSYEHIVEDEVMREIATWQDGREFETVEPMLRITLGSILRAVFGAEGAALDELRVLMPKMVTLGSRLVMLPPALRRDFGRWSPGGRFAQYRRRFDAIVHSLIAEARSDPAFEERGDVLAVLMQGHYENGEPIPDAHIADELLCFLAAGHETSASQLTWTLERLRRHPELMSRLADEVDAGGSALRHATIFEAQRIRPCVDGTVRRTKTRVRLGEWVLPEHTAVIVYNEIAHRSKENFADPETFDPDRFVGVSPPPFRWVPFGGGVNRCPGASFATMEMDVVLRTLLREFRFAPTNTRGERRINRGVAWMPSRGGRAVVYRRTSSAPADAGAASLTNRDTTSATS